jgi:hypothetical protein
MVGVSGMAAAEARALTTIKRHFRYLPAVNNGFSFALH